MNLLFTRTYSGKDEISINIDKIHYVLPMNDPDGTQRTMISFGNCDDNVTVCEAYESIKKKLSPERVDPMEKQNQLEVIQIQKIVDELYSKPGSTVNAITRHGTCRITYLGNDSWSIGNKKGVSKENLIEAIYNHNAPIGVHNPDPVDGYPDPDLVKWVQNYRKCTEYHHKLTTSFGIVDYYQTTGKWSCSLRQASGSTKQGLIAFFNELF